MPRLSNNVLCVTRVAAFLGTAQSLIWVIASIVALLSYNRCLFIGTPEYPNELFGIILHEHFFLSDECLTNKTLNFTDSEVVDASTLRIWVIINLVLNICWLISSLVMMIYAFGPWRKNIYFAASTWIFSTGCIVVADFTLGIMLGASYSRIGRIIVRYPQSPMVMQLVVLQFVTFCLMSVVLKGYVMLVINIVTLLMMLATVSGERNYLRHSRPTTQRCLIHAYGSMPSIRHVSQAPVETGTNWQQRGIDRVHHVNKPSGAPPYVPGPFNYNEPRLWASSSISGSPSPPPPPLPPRRPTHNAERIAAPAPPMPEPDYSPLGQRRLKPALKMTM